MHRSYFKIRKPFRFSVHPYDIGTSAGTWSGYYDNHFLLKIYKLNESEYPNYYNYHLNYTLENQIGTEKDFFKMAWQIVDNRIKHFQNQNPFSSSHAAHVKSAELLQRFQNYINSVDQWSLRPPHIVIAEKDEIIQKQKEEINKLQMQLTELEQYDVAKKISIHEGYFYSIIDLFMQMRLLNVPGKDRKILDCDFKSPYSKLLSRYFLKGNDPISIETMNNYFVNNVETSIKGTKIKPKDHIFQIVPIEPIK